MSHVNVPNRLLIDGRRKKTTIKIYSARSASLFDWCCQIKGVLMNEGCLLIGVEWKPHRVACKWGFSLW